MYKDNSHLLIMQEKNTQFVIFFINRLKSALKIKTDTELADYLGVKQSTISMWRKRDSVDIRLIITKCENISIDWLISGTGKMLKNETKVVNDVAKNEKCCNCEALKKELEDYKEKFFNAKEELIQCKEKYYKIYDKYLAHKEENLELKKKIYENEN